MNLFLLKKICLDIVSQKSYSTKTFNRAWIENGHLLTYRKKSIKLDLSRGETGSSFFGEDEIPPESLLIYLTNNVITEHSTPKTYNNKWREKIVKKTFGSDISKISMQQYIEIVKDIQELLQTKYDLYLNVSMVPAKQIKNTPKEQRFYKSPITTLNPTNEEDKIIQTVKELSSKQPYHLTLNPEKNEVTLWHLEAVLQKYGEGIDFVKGVMNSPKCRIKIPFSKDNKGTFLFSLFYEVGIRQASLEKNDIEEVYSDLFGFKDPLKFSSEIENNKRSSLFDNYRTILFRALKKFIDPPFSHEIMGNNYITCKLHNFKVLPLIKVEQM